MLFYLGLTITQAYAFHFADAQAGAQLGFSKAMLLVKRRLGFELRSRLGLDTEPWSI